MEMDSSNHICLICCQKIVGLVNYVDHFKTHTLTEDNSKLNLGVKDPADQQKQPAHQNSEYFESCSGNSSPLSEFINSTDGFPDSGLDADDLKHCPDFFQSLELKSATDDQQHKQKVKSVQRLSILEDDSHAESLLPITSILSNLDFSSDEEFLPISDNDDQTSPADNDDGFWSFDGGMTNPSSHPPPGHTGGKWKPGEGPKRRLPIAGKWKPGCGPGPACRKNILRKQLKLKNSKKTFYCAVCDCEFSDRISYSSHFSQQRHNDLANAKKQQRSSAEVILEGSQALVQSVRVGQKQSNVHNACYCVTCDLYFDNTAVYSVHCQTKLHKDKVQSCEGQGESKGSTVTASSQMPDPPSHLANRQLCDQPVSQVMDSHSCHICQKHFTRKYEMARHLLTRMHKARALEHPEALSVEMLNRYNKYMIRLSLYQCGICQFYCNRQGDFLDHMGGSKHLSICQDMLGPVVCVACKYKTHKHDQMMEHLQYPEHLMAVERKHGICIVRESHSRITCKFCGVKMHSAVRMLRHCQHKHRDRLSECQVLLDVKQVGYPQHTCPLCDKSFNSKSLLQLHFLKVHKNTSLFNCAVCNRGYLDQRRLDNHLRTMFHARRVIATKLKDATRLKVAALKKSAVLDRGKKRRGAKKKSKDIVKDVSEQQAKDPGGTESLTTKTMAGECQSEVPSAEAPQTLRRSTRKRKIVECFDDNSEEDWKHITASSRGNCSKRAVSKYLVKHDKSGGSCPAGNTSMDVVVCDEGKEEKRHKTKYLRRGRPAKPKVCEISAGSDLLQDLKNKSLTEVTPGKLVIKEEDGDLDKMTLEEVSKHIFSCAYCEFAAVDLTELREHYNQNHPDDVLACQPCNQYFLSLKAYKIHCSGRGHQLKLKEQSGETKVHKCPVCDKHFLQESCCLLHLETIHRHPSSESDLMRVSKGQDLVTQLYGDHVKQVDNLSNNSSVSCPECGKFVKKDTLVEHLRLHTGERPYVCRFCNKGFAGRLTLRRHISSHLNMPMFMCHTCGREFKRNSHLIKHIRQHDFEKKGEKHSCQICPAWFYTPEELTSHMRRHGQRNFKCTWPGCHWTFVLNGELKSHMLSHTGEKKYLCDTCGFGAPTKTRLRRHERIHDQSRNFNCDYCLYKASCKTHLKRHMRIHINSRPFACPYCTYTCNTHENIRKHILKTQKHKGMKLYPCKLCNTFGCDNSKDFRAHLMTCHEDYLRANAIDSLAVFSGLYKREEDYQKPQEGSVIVQVTKGRFFRSYQNPDTPAPPPKPKKTRKSSSRPKMEEVKVRIVPPSELGHFEDLAGGAEREPDQCTISDQLTEGVNLPQGQSDPQETSDEDDQSQNDCDTGEEDEESTNGATSPQYMTVPNMVIPSYDQQEAPPVTYPPQPHHIPVAEEKLYWTVVPEPKVMMTQAAPIQAPEPWYSGMPQVHAPTSQELQQYRHPAATTTTSTNATFVSNPNYCYIPVGEISAGGPVYTGILDSLVVINDPSRQNISI